MAKLPEDFFDAFKLVPTCSVCKGLQRKYDRSWFSPGMMDLSGKLVCMECIKIRLIFNGLLGTQRELEEPGW